MKIDLIQSNCSAINSIYIYKNFLENEGYFNHLLEKVKKHTQTDFQERKTQVKCTMTSWTALLQDADFNHIHTKMLETAWNTIQLRSPILGVKYKLSFQDGWAMRHTEGDYTQDHIHDYDLWSSVFYFDVPCETRMWFEDYQRDVVLENNMFIFFQGATKHRVSRHFGKIPRYSMANNFRIQQVRDDEKNGNSESK